MATTTRATISLTHSSRIKTGQTGAGSTSGGGTGTHEITISNASAANNEVGGGDLVYGPVVLTVAVGVPATLDLTSGLYDLNGNALVFARLKLWKFMLLGAGDTTQDGTTGNACSGINVSGNCLGGVGRPIDVASGEMEILNGGIWSQGSKTATGYTVTNGATDTITITNNDGAVAAKVLVFLGGGSS